MFRLWRRFFPLFSPCTACRRRAENIDSVILCLRVHSCEEYRVRERSFLNINANPLSRIVLPSADIQTMWHYLFLRFFFFFFSFLAPSTKKKEIKERLLIIRLCRHPISFSMPSFPVHSICIPIHRLTFPNVGRMATTFSLTFPVCCILSLSFRFAHAQKQLTTMCGKSTISSPSRFVQLTDV